MPIELPFEFDTIDAIAEAETIKEKSIAILIRILPVFFHSFCTIMEFMAYRILMSKIEQRIVCAKYFEITKAANLFLILDYFCGLSDLMFAILGLISICMLYNNPYTVFFNGLAGLLNIVGGAYYHIVAGLCGNPEQGLLYVVPILSYICGLLHIILAVLSHLSFMYLDKEGELYFGRTKDFIDEMRRR